MVDALSAAIVAAMAGEGARLRRGTVETVSPLTVSIEGFIVPAVDGQGGLLRQGGAVLTITQAGAVWVVAEISKRPLRGTISAIVGTTVTVTTASGTIASVPVIAGTAVLGQPATLLWGDSGCVAIVGGSTSTPAPMPAPGAVTPGDDDPILTPGGMDQDRWEDATMDVRPTTVCSSRGGAYRTDTQGARRAIQGYPLVIFGEADNRPSTGWFFYGGRLKYEGTAECISATLRLAAPSDGGAVFDLRTHTQQSKGSTPPTASTTRVKYASVKDGETVDVDLGVDVGQQMLTGAVRGLAVVSDSWLSYGTALGPVERTLAGRIVLKIRRKVSA